MSDPDAPLERELAQVGASDGDASEPHVSDALASRQREPLQAARLGHLRRRGIPEVEAIGEVEVREIGARGDERGEAGGAEPPGAGEVDGGDGRRGGERGEGGVGEAGAGGEVEAAALDAVGRRWHRRGHGEVDCNKKKGREGSNNGGRLARRMWRRRRREEETKQGGDEMTRVPRRRLDLGEERSPAGLPYMHNVQVQAWLANGGKLRGRVGVEW